MKIIAFPVYKFRELNEEAKQKALEELRDKITDFIDVASYIIDDCALLEPDHKDLVETFGTGYGTMFKRDFLIVNNRNVLFNTERRKLDISNAMEIDDDGLFLQYLGIPYDLMDKISYRILPVNIAFDYEDDLTEDEIDFLDKAEEKFDKLIKTIWGRITSTSDVVYSDEFLIDYAFDNGIEFTEAGKIYKPEK